VKLSDKNYTPIVHTMTNGLYHMDLTRPDLEFELVEPDSHPFEFCKTFQVKVYVTHICANLKDYNLVILYDTELLKLTGVDWTGGVLLGSPEASSTESPAGTINVIDTGGTTWSGLKGLLFTLTFHIEFDDRIEHIWRTNAPHDLTAHVSFANAELSFLEGTIYMSGITMPLLPLDIVVHLIQGDVDCDGNVDVTDLRCVAAGYDKTSSDPEWTTGQYWSKYNLKAEDNTIDIFDLVVLATNFGYGGL